MFRMFKLHNLLHLRIAFSFLLLPVGLFALLVAGQVSTTALIMTAVLYLLVFTSSNAYNSYHDRDTDSIGTLRRPPPVDRSLLWLCNTLDVLAVILSSLLHPVLTAGVIMYIVVSRLYSHRKTRLKRLPWLSLAVVMVFQGALTYLLLVFAALPDWSVFSDVRHLAGATACMLITGGIYPVTQIYQHREDRERGDVTVSMQLGIRGSFIFTGVLLGQDEGGDLRDVLLDHTLSLGPDVGLKAPPTHSTDHRPVLTHQHFGLATHRQRALAGNDGTQGTTMTVLLQAQNFRKHVVHTDDLRPVNRANSLE
jgi:4-hydroxybenzoate polyprenyltransferase